MEDWAEIRRRVLVDGLSKRAACREYDLHWSTLEKILATTSRPVIAAGAAAEAQARALPGRHPSDPRGRPDGPEEAAAHRRADLRAAPRRVRLRGRPDRRQGGRRRLEAADGRGLRAARAPPGEAQVDFGDAEVVLDGEPVKVALFVMTLPYSDALFCWSSRASAPRRSSKGTSAPSPSSAASRAGSATTTPRSPSPRSPAAGAAS